MIIESVGEAMSFGEAGSTAKLGSIGEVAAPFDEIASSSSLLLLLCTIVGQSGIIEGHK